MACDMPRLMTHTLGAGSGKNLYSDHMLQHMMMSHILVQLLRACAGEWVHEPVLAEFTLQSCPRRDTAILQVSQCLTREICDNASIGHNQMRPS